MGIASRERLVKSSTAFSRILLMGSLVFGVVLAGPAAAQQTYPDRPIRIILPYPPGGTYDTLARMLGQKLTSSWGQPVVVDYRPGGDTIIATEALVKSPPDGYTLTLQANTMAINPHTHRKLPYDTFKDLVPIATFAVNQQVFAVSPSVKANNLQEFIAQAKARPGEFNHGTPGSGGIVHLSLALFNSMAGVKVQHVPYKGSAQAMTDLIGGQVQVSFAPPILVKPYIDSGKIKALAVTGEHRTPSLPQVPTFAEAGLPGFDMKLWYGLLAPAGTPKSITDKLSTEIARIVAAPETREFLAAQGFEPFYNNAEQFGALMKSDFSKYGQIVKAGNFKIED
jgi:tripartite-type tricarboxylate transporter receptor subunit TctC